MIVNTSVRIPTQIYQQLVALKERKPHMSLNALIVEAISRELEKQV